MKTLQAEWRRVVTGEVRGEVPYNLARTKYRVFFSGYDVFDILGSDRISLWGVRFWIVQDKHIVLLKILSKETEPRCPTLRSAAGEILSSRVPTKTSCEKVDISIRGSGHEHVYTFT